MTYDKEGLPLFTNGEDVFPLFETTRNEDDSLSGVGQDIHGGYYFRCEAGACDHSQAPAGADVWHDREHTETIWPAHDGQEIRPEEKA